MVMWTFLQQLTPLLSIEILSPAVINLKVVFQTIGSIWLQVDFKAYLQKAALHFLLIL